MPGVVKGHNAAQGYPLPAEQMQPPTPSVDGGALIAGHPSEVPSRCLDLHAAQFEIFSSGDESPNKAIGVGEGSGIAKGSNVPQRCPTPSEQAPVPTPTVDTGRDFIANDLSESPDGVGIICSLPESYRRLALLFHVHGNTKLHRVDLHKLVLQEFFDDWKESTRRNLISDVLDEGGESKEIELTEAGTDSMKHLCDCMKKKR